MLARFVVAISLCIPTASFATTVDGSPGESAPGNSVSPNPATPLDVIQFSLNTDSQTYGNECEQHNAFDGIHGLEFNYAERIVDVISIEPAPAACTRIYSPVTGVRGELDSQSLSPGSWIIQDAFGNAASVNVLFYGDANKDGRFDSSDFVQVFKAAEYEDAIPNNSTWEEGDWTGDGDFTTADFVVAFRSLPQAAVLQIPEPALGSMIVPFVGFVVISFRRQIRYNS